MEKKLIEKYNRKFKKATLMDDLKFRKICEEKEVVEEILRVILKDDTLVVIETIKQSNEDEPMFHGVILDCKCRLKTKEIVNIEVQVAYNDNPIYRMRYNSSILTVENSPKSQMFKYEKIPKIITIMFCEFDIFKKNKPIYEIDRIVRGTKIVAENGIREIYINLKSKTNEKRLKSLFKVMTTVDEVDEKTFPKLSKRKKEINKMIIGGNKNMQGLTLEMYKDGIKEGRQQGIKQGLNQGIKQGLNKGIKQGSIKVFVKLYKNKIVSKEYAAKELNITEKEFMKLVK